MVQLHNFEDLEDEEKYEVKADEIIAKVEILMNELPYEERKDLVLCMMLWILNDTDNDSELCKYWHDKQFWEHIKQYQLPDTHPTLIRQ